MVGLTWVPGTCCWTSVAADCAMNRERSLSGSNGHGRTHAPGARPTPVRWLDLCCERGRARLVAERVLAERVQIVGFDLADSFSPALRLTEWVPDGRFDLITRLHGPQYGWAR
ncbi:hypothetical protein [Actinoallomurus acaciae]|uniref:Class I SAM-dependent methyltransferase n=1 Tax=Actinoallomurus acaciae TaxID=502577 RepID=A0ABV5YHF5_9ACTN